MTTKANIIGMAPELTSQPDGVFDFFVPLADSRVNTREWPTAQVNAAQTLMGAHMITLKITGEGGGAGAITSKAAGSVSVGYQGSTDALGKSDLHLTNYGRMFLALQKNLGATPRTIVAGRHIPKGHRRFG